VPLGPAAADELAVLDDREVTDMVAVLPLLRCGCLVGTDTDCLRRGVFEAEDSSSDGIEEDACEVGGDMVSSATLFPPKTRANGARVRSVGPCSGCAASAPASWLLVS